MRVSNGNIALNNFPQTAEYHTISGNGDFCTRAVDPVNVEANPIQSSEAKIFCVVGQHPKDLVEIGLKENEPAVTSGIDLNVPI